MSVAVRTWLVLALFLLGHLWLIVANLRVAPHTFADVSLYDWWWGQALSGHVQGIHEDWVYPIGAWLPLGAAGALGFGNYGLGWLALVTLLDALVVVRLLRRERGAELALTYLGLQLLAGPIAVGRIDAITVPIVTVALLAMLERRNGLAATLFTLGAWIKVWPGVLYLLLLVLRGRDWRKILGAGAAVSAGFVVPALLLGSGGTVFSFLTQQGGRGLQVESVAATAYMWQAMAGGGEVYYDDQILTWQVRGGGAEHMAAILNPVLIVAVLTLLGLVSWARREDRRVAGLDADLPRQEAVLLALASMALVTTLLITNKVGSPQFVLWLIPVAVLFVAVRVRNLPWWLGLLGAQAFLTQLIYPWRYSDVLEPSLFGVMLLTARNAVTLVLFATATGALSAPAVRPRPVAEPASAEPEVAEAPTLLR